MKRIVFAVVFLAGCSIAPRVVEDRHGTHMSYAPVMTYTKWVRWPVHVFDLSAKWDGRESDKIVLIASVPGYTDISHDGLRFSCEGFRVDLSSNDAVHHSLDGASSSRSFVSTRDQFAHLLSCHEFDVALDTDSGVKEGYAKKSSHLVNGLKSFANRITKLEQFRN